MNNPKEMESISQSEKEDFICQTCGDVGFTNAFVYCVKCLDFVIHRYCLYVIPKTFTERVIWYCESCKPVVQNQSTSPQVQSSPSQKIKPKKKINPIWSETSSSDSDSDSDSSSCSSNRNIFDEWEARIAQQNQRVDRIIEDMIISYPHLILGDNNPFGAKNWSLIAETNEVFCHSLTDTNREMESNASQDNYYTHAQPIIDPVWRGSFSARVHGTNCDVILEGLVGHLSNKACGKVCEEASMLPSLLELQMQPKSLLWPRSFQEDTEASDDHIALYFFPGDPINERGFDDLVVDMMDGGLAMRATVTNADLLIFTSASLPLSLRRFQGKYYLWGVFRGKRSGPTSEAGVDMDSECED